MLELMNWLSGNLSVSNASRRIALFKYLQGITCFGLVGTMKSFGHMNSAVSYIIKHALTRANQWP